MNNIGGPELARSWSAFSTSAKFAAQTRQFGDAGSTLDLTEDSSTLNLS
jgi:hypothetical protein